MEYVNTEDLDIDLELGESRVDRLNSPIWDERSIHIFVKRDDLIHPIISGNKWRKLKFNVELCLNLKKNGILTFGGAYSNHLVATAAACQSAGITSIGIVRGDELNENSNETLKQCTSLGMKLVFISREEYALRNDREYHQKLGAEYRLMHLVPEGGANYYGIIGCQEIMQEINVEIDDVFIAQGTTTTSCGVLLSLKDHQRLHVIPVLKKFDSIGEMKSLLLKGGFDQEMTDDLLDQVIVHDDFHFGGYGKFPQDLLDFITNFHFEYKLKLDPIYTGKAMKCMISNLENDEFSGKSVLFIHTGGLQGGRGIVDFSE